MSENPNRRTAKCPFCSKLIVHEHGKPPTFCEHCYHHLPSEIRAQLDPAHAVPRSSPQQSQASADVATIDNPSLTPFGESRSPFSQRYIDLYRAARLLVGLGTTVKTVGLAAAGIILAFWFIVGVFALSQPERSSSFGGSATASAAQVVTFFICVVIGAVFGVLIGGVSFLLGVLISAQGQLLMTHADSAVYASPFLSDEERAAAMSLPYTPPAVAAAAG